VALRVAALLVFLHQLTGLIATLLQTYDAVVPSYLIYYVKQHLIRPLAGMAVAAFVWKLAVPLGKRAARPVTES
jgi:hypothetical protein